MRVYFLFCSCGFLDSQDAERATMKEAHQAERVSLVCFARLARLLACQPQSIGLARQLIGLRSIPFVVAQSKRAAGRWPAAGERQGLCQAVPLVGLRSISCRTVRARIWPSSDIHTLCVAGSVDSHP